jgi:MFS family permease
MNHAHESIQPSRRAWLSVAAYAAMFVFGIVMALLGAVLPVLSEQLELDLARAGNLFFTLNFAVMLSMLGIGPLMDRAGKRPVLMCSSSLCRFS